MEVLAGDATQSGMDALPREGDVAGTGIGVEVLAGDAAQSGMDALLGEVDIAGTKAQEVKPERSSAKGAPTETEDDPWPERRTKEDKDKRPPWYPFAKMRPPDCPP